MAKSEYELNKEKDNKIQSIYVNTNNIQSLFEMIEGCSTVEVSNDTYESMKEQLIGEFITYGKVI